jgi:hypothetical protein
VTRPRLPSAPRLLAHSGTILESCSESCSESWFLSIQAGQHFDRPSSPLAAPGIAILAHRKTGWHGSC